jgi:DNA polymerase-3 subunit gamma/tau
MSYEPLHQKYRPQTFADLVGQSAIADTLSNAIDRQRIAPAYLFSGPRGTGKTSSARILAKSLNCIRSNQPTPQPCGQCEVCRAISNNSALDVIEIDAASNTGVDNIREIIERSSFAPVQCRYKLYVIDEAHMLSTAAFNALLKTLEEPPPRVLFVLATTDPQRVLPTIISRCQRFDFQRIPLAAMVSHLQYIAQQEAIEITEDALAAIAQVAHGGLRDAQSLLDQLSLLSGTITLERVWDLVGAIPEQDLIALLKAIKQQNPNQILALCRQLMDRGREPIIVLENLAGIYRDLLIAKTAPQQAELVALTASTWEELCDLAQQWQLAEILRGQKHLQNSEAQIKHTTQPRLWLEVTLLQLLSSDQEAEVTPPVKTVSSAPQQPSSQPLKKNIEPSAVTSTTPAAPSHIEKPVSPASPSSEKEEKTTTPPSASSPPSSEKEEKEDKKESPTVSSPSESVESGNEDQIWAQVLERLSIPSQSLFREHCRLLAVQGNVVQVGVKNEKLLSFAKSQRRQKDLEQALKGILQREIKVNLKVTGESTIDSPPKEKSESVPSPSSTPTKKKDNPPEHYESNGGQSVESSPVEEEKEQSTEEKSPSVSTPEVNSETTTDEKTLEEVAKELAKAFQGEIVEFDNNEFDHG